jgi:hypothetical protein
MASTKDQPTTTLIKRDRTGRHQYTQQYRQEVIAAYEASGMSGAAFARQCGIKYPTFASWVSKRRREHLPAVVADRGAQSFVLAEIITGDRGAGLHVALPGGASAKLEDPSQAALLAGLIKALA